MLAKIKYGKQLVADFTIQILKIPTENKPADMLTQPKSDDDYVNEWASKLGVTMNFS